MTVCDITPLVLTFNEAPNLARCLDRLRWAGRVLIIDSGSTDATLSIAQGYANVEVVQRAFDSFAAQCNYGLSLITTPWVLSLDCDYVLGAGFEAEAAAVIQDDTHCGWRAGFRYCIHGQPLRGTLYPARCVLYRVAAANYRNEGHGHRVQIEGAVGELATRIDHDDRKPLGRWFQSQIHYAAAEADFLLGAPASELGQIDRLRRLGWLLPCLAPVYCLLVKGLWRDGWAGWHYTLQRWVAECMIALALAEQRLNPTAKETTR